MTRAWVLAEGSVVSVVSLGAKRIPARFANSHRRGGTDSDAVNRVVTHATHESTETGDSAVLFRDG